MASRELPGLGLNGFWNLGEDGWNTGMDENLLVLSALAQGAVLSRTTALPGTPVDGDIYIVPVGSGGTSNQIAVRDNGAWTYLVPQQGWLVYVIDAAEFRYFTGASWALLSTGGGGGGGAAEDITYDGGSGGPNNVQDALDLLFAASGGADDQTAAEVPYSGVTGGPNNVQDALDELFNAPPSGSFSSVNAQTGTSYTPVLADRENVLITLSNASPISLILPQDSAVAFPIGTVLNAMQLGAGLVSFQAGSGATVNSRGGALDSAGQYAMLVAVKVSANTWVVSGDIE